MTDRADRRVPLAVGVFVWFAAAAAWFYAPVDPPGGLVLVALVVLWLAAFSTATLGYGLPLWRVVTGSTPRDADGWTAAAALGAGTLAALAGLLGAVGWLRPVPLLGLLALGAMAGARDVWRAIPWPRPSGWPLAAAAVLTLVGVLTLLAVGSPSPFYDQFHYHLAFPEQWLRAGRIAVFPRHAYSYLTANMGLLYTYALAGPGIWAAQTLHWWMGLLSVVAAYRIARSAGAGVRGAGWSAAVLAATPAVLLSASWAAADLGAAAFGGVACLLALRPAPAERDTRTHVACGALCGLAFGCKYLALATVALPVAVVVAGGALWSTAGRGGPAVLFRRLAAWSVGLAALSLPWLARNLWLTGDPVYPFLTRLWGDAEASAAARGIAASAGGGALQALFTLGTFDPQGAAGRIGPLWLALIPLWLVTLVALRRDRRSVLLLGAVFSGVLAWSRVHHLGRYLVPVLVLAAGAIGPVVERTIYASTGVVRRLGIGVLLVGTLWSAQGGLDRELFTRVASTLGRADPHELLARYVTYWPALPILHERVPEDARVLLVGEPRSLHIDREVVVEDPFRQPYLQELAETSATPSEMARHLALEGVTHVLYNEREAARIARMTGRESYLVATTRESGARLRDFLDDCLSLVGEAAPVRVYRLDAGCPGGAPASASGAP